MSSRKYPCKKEVCIGKMSASPKKQVLFLGDRPHNFTSTTFTGDWLHVAYIHNYLENQLLLISINFTPETSHSCLKKGYTRFSRYQVYTLKDVPLCNETIISGCRCDTELNVLMPCRDGKRRWWNARKHPPSAWSVCLPWS